MVATFFFVEVSPRNIFLVVIISGDSSLIWMSEEVFFFSNTKSSLLLQSWEGLIGKVTFPWRITITTAKAQIHTTNSLPCYTRQRDVGKEFFRKLILKIENKKDLIRGGHHRLATRPLCRNQKSRHFSRTMRPAEFGPTTFSSHVYTSFLSPHIILSRM